MQKEEGKKWRKEQARKGREARKEAAKAEAAQDGAAAKLTAKARVAALSYREVQGELQEHHVNAKGKSSILEERLEG